MCLKIQIVLQNYAKKEVINYYENSKKLMVYINLSREETDHLP